jgi:hypothetical protein
MYSYTSLRLMSLTAFCSSIHIHYQKLEISVIFLSGSHTSRHTLLDAYFHLFSEQTHRLANMFRAKQALNTTHG